MSFGKRSNEARKEQGSSQEELSEMIGTKGPAIGRYEREEITPSVEVALKLAKILVVSFDYLTGFTDLELDQSTVKRIEDISKLSDSAKDYIFGLIDMALRDFKTRKAYA